MHDIKYWGLVTLLALLSSAFAQEGILRINAGGVQWIGDRYHTAVAERIAPALAQSAEASASGIAASALVPPERPGVSWARFPVHPVNGSGIQGSVLVRDLDDLGTIIVIALSDTQPGILYLSSLQKGTCDSASRPITALEDVRGTTGFSSSTIDRPYHEILDGGTVLNIYLNERERVACAVIGPFTE